MAAEHVTEPDWDKLQYPKRLIDGVRETLEQADTEVLDPALLGPTFGSDVGTTTRLLQDIAELVQLNREEITLCGNCENVASAQDRAMGTCPRCLKRYEELDTPFKTKVVFKLPEGRRGRDVSWVITVHGMNTDGPWQQDFSWLIANKLKYSAPVLILKYPILRGMVAFQRTQDLLVDDLGQRIQAAIGHATQRNDELSERPDVVLHSYGTLLFSQLLLREEFKGLTFGRVIVAGSIVPPDYDWAEHVNSGRIERVVNHCGDKDWVVLLAQFAIPRSGPSGRHGFVNAAALNVRAPDYGHGTFFDIEPMKKNLVEGGMWDRFLTYPPDRLTGDHAMQGPAQWSPHPLAAFARLVVKVLVIAGGGTLVWFVLQLIAAIKAVITGK